MPSTSNQAKKLVGILALQGDFEAHEKALESAGADTLQVRTAEDLARVDALVIPGGESTTMLKLLGYMNLLEPLRSFADAKPVFGTCAGAILLANEVESPSQPSLGVIDMTIERNAYGRQIDSRVTQVDFEGTPLEAVFIRAPIIRRTGPGVRVLAEYQGTPVLIESGRHLASTFHPELTGDSRVHSLFLSKI
jgi:5'-phosphate synthase pdxT subunit